MHATHYPRALAASTLPRFVLLVAVSLLGVTASFALLGSVQPMAAVGQRPDKGDALEAADLMIDVMAPDTARAGDVLTYVLQYTNTKNFALNGVVLTDSLSGKQWYYGTYIATPPVPPANFTWSGSLANGWRANWQLGTLAPGAAGTIVLTATIPYTYQPTLGPPVVGPTTLGNAAVITTTTPGVTGGQDSVASLIVGPVLKVTKAAYPTDARPGNPLTYTVYITNQTVAQRPDTIAATDLVITDVLPANVTFVSAEQGGVYSPTVNWVIWHVPGPLNPGAGLGLRFKVRLFENLADRVQIKNQYYCALSAEIRANTPCGTAHAITSGSLLEKTVVTGPPNPYSNPPKVWPQELVTYTIQVWNPHEVTMTVRLTDTVPGNPEKFTFQYMVTGPAPVITAPYVVWDGVPIAPQTYAEIAFAVRVPASTLVTNDTGAIYSNSLSATSTDGYVFPSRSNIAWVLVVPRVTLYKTVNPSHNLAGRPVTYTIEMNNNSTLPVRITRVTDTLPVQFTYAGTITGPQPVYQQGNIVAWGGFTIPASQVIYITFRATVYGTPLSRVCNSVSALSPDSGIPSKTNLGCVTVDTPLLGNKVADPATVYVGDSTSYNISYTNASTTTYTIDQVADNLPAGFLWNGFPSYVLDLVPPVSIAPGETWYTGPFPVAVTKAVGCSTLPRTIRQPVGAVVLHVTDPTPGYWVNGVELGPVTVNPNATIVKTSYHNYVTPGEILSYTISVANTSPTHLTGVVITDTLPDGFSYVDMVQGPPPADPTPPTIVWNNLEIPAGATYVLVFNARATVVASTTPYRNNVTGSTTANACIKSALNTAAVYVVGNVVQVTKTANSTSIPPAGTLDYTIDMRNRDQVALRALRITDTLPDDFTFLAVTSGPTATLIPPRTLVWSNINLPPNSASTQIKVRVQASILFGAYGNVVEGTLPRGGPLGPAWVTVTVVPGVALFKTVYPTESYYAGTVVYTMTLLNRSTQAVNNVTITDTVPADFHYGGMIAGPNPTIVAGRVLIWSGQNVGVNGRIEYVYRASLFPASPGIYWNNVIGSSPTVEIPDPGDTAPLLVLSGFRQYLPLYSRNFSP